MKKIIAIIILSSLTLSIYAQGPFFLNSPQNYLWYNPAHAGADSVHEFTLSGQNRWEKSYQTLMLSYEQPVYKIHSGVGGLIMRDDQGDGQIIKYYIAPCFNYNVTIANKMSLRVGVQPTFNHFYIN